VIFAPAMEFDGATGLLEDAHPRAVTRLAAKTISPTNLFIYGLQEGLYPINEMRLIPAVVRRNELT
jgi:hypothetical protein